MKHEDIKLILNSDEYVGKKVTVCGWVRAIRKSKNMCFIEINDGTSLLNLQLVVNYDYIESKDLFKNLNIGSSLIANGIIVTAMNQNQAVELNAEIVQLLGNCPNDYPIQKKNKIWSI